MNEPPTIVLVDDQVDHLNAVQFMLEAVGYRVIACATGTECLRVLDAQSVDLILADVAMPQMNGYQLLDQVRKHPEWATIPFVFLTARALDSDIRYGKSLGVDDYLTKPIQPEDLLAVVEGKLRRSQQLRGSGVRGAEESHPNAVHVGPLQIDTAHHRAWWSECLLSLSVREFALLAYLAQHADSVVSATDLVRVTHGLETTDADEARELIRPLIRSVRRKIEEAAGNAETIETVRGLGYRMLIPMNE